MQSKKSPDSKDDIGLSLIETIQSSEFADVAQDLAEVGLDAILTDGIFRELPIVSTIVRVTKTVLAIRDKLLLRKIYTFLRELRGVSETERERFAAEMENDSNYQRQVGENLIMLLDRLDDLDKPTLVAKVFKAYLKGDINYHQFLRFAAVIDKILVKDLQNLLETISSRKGSPEVFAEYLYQFGLSKIEFDDTLFVKTGSVINELKHSRGASFFPSKSPVQFSLTQSALLLVQILLEKQMDTVDYVADNRKEIQRERHPHRSPEG